MVEPGQGPGTNRLHETVETFKLHLNQDMAGTPVPVLVSAPVLLSVNTPLDSVKNLLYPPKRNPRGGGIIVVDNDISTWVI